MNTYRNNSRRRGRQRGVTLIEMLVVVAIIALFATLVGPQMFKKFDTTKTTAARAQINNFKNALGQYKMDTSTYPTTEQGLVALRLKPENVPNWDGPYLDQDVPTDPWGRPYAYKYPGDHGDTPEIVSLGADGQPGGDGVNADVVSWKN